MANFESGCCGAEIFQADKNGHGHCVECGEQCTPYEGEEENEDEYIQQMADRLGGGRDKNSASIYVRASVAKQVFGFLTKHNIPVIICANGGWVRMWINTYGGTNSVR